ncbi:MAG: hypothetical protein KIS85_06280 [Anaerolineales bacterium]|nr:hypothetical protein [Anaerolineales bacterium]
MTDPTIRIFIQAVNQAGGAIAEVDRDISKKLASIGKIAAVASTAGLALSAMWKAGREGAQIDYDRTRFERLAASIGTTGDALETKLRPAMRGLVSDAQLWAATSDLMGLGLAKNEDHAVRLASVVSALDMNMNQLVLTLSNRTTMRFDTLGVSVDGFKERLAALEAQGYSTEDAFTEAFLQQAEEQVLKVGHAADTTLGAFKRLEAQGATAGQRLKTQWAELFAPLADWMADGLENTNALNRAVDALGATQVRAQKDGDLYVQTYYELNGVLLTANDLLRQHQLLLELGPEKYEKFATGVEAAGGNLRGWTADMGRWAAQAPDMSGLVAGVKGATDEIQRSFDDIDPKFDTKVAGWIKDLEFVMAGGLQLQQSSDLIAAAWGEGKITDEQAKEMLGAVYAEAQNLQMELGNIDAKQAAENIASTLGVTLDDARQMVTDMQDGLSLLDGSTTEMGVHIVASGDTWISQWLGGGAITVQSRSGGGGNAAAPTGGGDVHFRAKGGPLNPSGGTLVGEEGPELIIGGYVFNAGLTRLLMAAGLLPDERRASGGALGMSAFPDVPGYGVWTGSPPPKYYERDWSQGGAVVRAGTAGRPVAGGGGGAAMGGGGGGSPEAVAAQAVAQAQAEFAQIVEAAATKTMQGSGQLDAMQISQQVAEATAKEIRKGQAETAALLKDLINVASGLATNDGIGRKFESVAGRLR